MEKAHQLKDDLLDFQKRFVDGTSRSREFCTSSSIESAIPSISARLTCRLSQARTILFISLTLSKDWRLPSLFITTMGICSTNS